ncbi:hypothetical protein D9M71_674270 [compost metagenome]
MLQVGIEAFGVETAKQGFTGKVFPGAFQVGELFTATQGTAGRRQTVDETEAFGRTYDPLIGSGQHWRVEHHHPAIQLRAAQGRMQVQHPTEGVTDAPHGLSLLLQVMDQLIHQVVPVVVRRVTRVVGVLLQMRHLKLGCQRRKQLAVGPRRKTIGVGEKDLLRHTCKSMSENRR